MSFISPTNYMRASDGFSPPTMGGALAVKYGALYEADSTAKQLFVLPDGAVPVLFCVNVVEAFNGTTSQTIDITHASGTFANDLDVSATGQIVTGFIPGSLNARFSETSVYGVYNDTVATAGTAYVTCFYMTKDV